MNEEQTIRQNLMLRASRYNQCLSECGKMETDIFALRYIHDQVKSEEERQRYKIEYQLFKEDTR